MERVIPWEDVLAVIEPHYPKGTRGGPPIRLPRRHWLPASRTTTARRKAQLFIRWGRAIPQCFPPTATRSTFCYSRTTY